MIICYSNSQKRTGDPIDSIIPLVEYRINNRIANNHIGPNSPSSSDEDYISDDEEFNKYFS